MGDRTLEFRWTRKRQTLGRWFGLQRMSQGLMNVPESQVLEMCNLLNLDI